MFAEDLAAFFRPEDHGTEATYTPAGGDPVVVRGIFNRPYAEAFAGVVEGSAPSFVCDEADVAGVAHGDSLVVNATTYTVRGVEPDGTGVVLLTLEAA